MKIFLSLSAILLAGLHLSCSAGERLIELGGCRLILDDMYSCLDLKRSEGMLCNAYAKDQAVSLTFYSVSYAENLESRPYVSKEEISVGRQKVMMYTYDLSGEGDLANIFVIKGTEKILEINSDRSFALRIAESCKGEE